MIDHLDTRISKALHQLVGTAPPAPPYESLGSQPIRTRRRPGARGPLPVLATAGAVGVVTAGLIAVVALVADSGPNAIEVSTAPVASPWFVPPSGAGAVQSVDVGAAERPARALVAPVRATRDLRHFITVEASPRRDWVFDDEQGFETTDVETRHGTGRRYDDASAQSSFLFVNRAGPTLVLEGHLDQAALLVPVADAVDLSDDVQMSFPRLPDGLTVVSSSPGRRYEQALMSVELGGLLLTVEQLSPVESAGGLALTGHSGPVRDVRVRESQGWVLLNEDPGGRTVDRRLAWVEDGTLVIVRGDSVPLDALHAAVDTLVRATSDDWEDVARSLDG